MFARRQSSTTISGSTFIANIALYMMWSPFGGVKELGVYSSKKGNKSMPKEQRTYTKESS
jgi:hypothetical protein